MAETTYQLNGELPENIPGFEQYQDKDLNLIESFQINSLFNPTKNFSELHILDLGDSILSSKYYYTGYTLSLNAQSAGKEGASVLTIDPIQDALNSGYFFGGIKLLYHFLNDLYTPDNTTLDFYIDSISPDRTEIQLLTNKLTVEDIVSYTESVKTNLKSQSYFSEFRLNFKNNNLLIGINLDNLDTVNGKAVVVKLYEPLPDDFDIKSTLSLVEVISDSVAYELGYQQTLDEPVPPTLRSANFNLDLQDESVIPTQYLNYDDLLSYKVGNTNSEIYSMISEKGVELSIDYSDYSNFIHFSSAQERLLNFKYKLDLLASYSQSLSTKGSATGGTQGVSGSVAYYEGLYQGLINNFDHYERFLYYESGSNSWPKTNNKKPYTNQASSLATTWYSSALTAAVAYDNTNYNSLVETIPAYLRDDPTNENYLTFIYMVGQHFDNLWVYGDAVTDKYDNDNRLNHGISKDLVGEALKNFGVKLYTSNKSVSDLFSTFIGQAYQSGSEKITSYITGSLTGSNTPIQPTSFDNYQKEIQKRIYHNLPLLLKSKGTERGLRALINCFGIPADTLDIKLYGGRNIYKKPNLGDSQYYTSSLDKIRLDTTGSLITGNTLSNYTSIIKRNDNYTDDIHVIEVGFSPTDNVDNYIVSRSAATFNIDDYLGDPRSLYSDNYSGLYRTANTLLSSSLGTSGSYDLRDYVRLIKFFDNTIFKMVKDFIPARSVADTGIIIKPNILNVSKAKSVRVSGSRPEYTGSIDTAFVSAENASIYRNKAAEATTAYTDLIQTPTGVVSTQNLHGQEQAKYNGELSKSLIVASTRDLNKGNPYKTLSYVENTYDIVFVSASDNICVLEPSTAPEGIFYISPNKTYTATDFFSNIGTETAYSASNGGTVLPPSPVYTGIPLGNPYSFTGRNQYDYFYIKADNWLYPGPGLCTQRVTARYGICALGLTTTGTEIQYVQPWTTDSQKSYDLVSWFTQDIKQTNLQYTASYGGNNYGISNPGAYQFPSTGIDALEVTIKLRDTKLGVTCEVSKTVTVDVFTIGVLSPPSIYGHEFKYSYNYSYGQSNRYYLDPQSIQSTNVSFYYTAPIGGTRIRTLGDTDKPTFGVQGYFTPFTKTDLIQNSNLRYNIYELRKNDNNTYSLTLPPLNASVLPRRNYYLEMDPPEPSSATTRTCAASAGIPPNGGVSGVYSEDKTRGRYNVDGYDRSSICIIYNNRTPDDVYTFPGLPYELTPTPLTVETPSLNSQYYCGYSPGSDRCYVLTGQPNPVNSLIQAYVVEVFDSTSERNIYGRYVKKQQVEVYGDKDILADVKEWDLRQVLSASYTRTWLLVGWNYATQVDPGPPGIPPAGYGPWVEVNIRKLTLNDGTVI